MTILPIGSTGRIPAWTVADRLRKARESAGLEQAELALMTGMARATISAAENGKRVPSKTNLNLWALATGVQREWLLNGETPPTEDGVSEKYTPRDLNPEPTDYGSVIHARFGREPLDLGGEAA